MAFRCPIRKAISVFWNRGHVPTFREESPGGAGPLVVTDPPMSDNQGAKTVLLDSGVRNGLDARDSAIPKRCSRTKVPVLAYTDY